MSAIFCSFNMKSNKKKILYIHHGKGLGGAPLSLLYLIEGLNKNIYDPVVLFLHNSEAMDLYKSRGINVEGPVDILDFPHSKIRWYRLYHPHLFFKSIFGSLKILHNVADFWYKKIKPDLVHLNTSSLSAWASVAYKKNIPVVWHIREPLSDGYFGIRKKLITNFVKKYSTVIMPICKNDSKPWKNNKKVCVVYNSVDEKIFDKNILVKDFLIEKKLSKFVPKILFLGGLSKEKGTLVIFEIFRRLLNVLPQAKLLIAGYFDLSLKNVFNLKRYFPSQRYKIKVKKILGQVEKSVLFLGSVKNVSQVIAASDVIIVPSTVGHFARPVIEAGFMSKPVVVTNLLPLDELVINGKTGFLINKNDYKVWIEKLHTLLINKKFNEKMGEKAFEYCVNKFNVEDQVKKVEDIYKNILL